MRWLIDIFYLHPLRVVFMVLASYAVAAIWLLPKGARKAQEAASATGLKQITLNKFLQYINSREKVIGNRDLDGSKAGMPLIESILTGRYDDFTVTLFMFCLPTGRTGIWQIVTHVRSATEILPDISIHDETFTPGLPELLKDDSGRKKFRFMDTFIEGAARSGTVDDKNVTDQLRSVKGLVLYANGHDLFFYVKGKHAEPSEYQTLVRKGMKVFQMIKSGILDMSVISESEAEKAFSWYLCSKCLLVMLPALVAMLLVGYGYKAFSYGLIITVMLFYVLAKSRYNKYRNLYPQGKS